MGLFFQNDGFHFTKRRVYFLRGGTPLFFSLWVLTLLRVLSSLWVLTLLRVLSSLWVLGRRFCSFWVGAFVRFASVFRSCCFFACSSTFLWLDSSFFLILFGGFDFVRTFAARNSVWSSAPGCIPGSVAPFAISFLRV